MEFAYFGPGTPQFLAGLFAVPAGGLMIAAAIRLLVSQPSYFSRLLVLIAGIGMLLATAIGTFVRVMGPPATVAGAFGGVVALMVNRSSIFSLRR